MSMLAMANRLMAIRPITVPSRVRSILNKYSGSAHIPGVSGVLRFGYQPGNYRESTGQTLAAADQQVGLVVNAARVPGNNLVNPANWLAGSGTVISGGVATSTAVTAGVNVIQQDNIGVTSKMLEVTITITVVSGGAVIRPGGVNGPTITASGTYTQRLQAGAADAFRVIAGASGFTGSITLSSISVRELPGIHASQSTSGFQPVLRNTSGIQSWQFDGTDDRLPLSVVPFQMSDDHFVVVGAQPSSVKVQDLFSCVSTSSSVPLWPLLRLDATGQLACFWRNNENQQTIRSISAAYSAGSNVVLTAVRRGTYGLVRSDGVASAPSDVPSSGTITLDSAAIYASLRSGNQTFMGGNGHGVIFGKGAISDSELLTLEKFMASLQGRQL